jgi:tRNA(Ile)-lysidine synthase
MGILRKPDIGFSPTALAHVLFDRLQLVADASLKIAYSGGLDSHVLLHALVALRTTYPLRLVAVHVDHGLSPLSPAWSRHCFAVCQALDVPFIPMSVEVEVGSGEGREAAARRARYAALARQVGPDDVLLTAHHQDDQAETLLLQLLRGAGVQGLAGMRAATGFSAGRHVRPLLAFRRAALRHYAESAGLQWVEDPSNADVGYRRNLLRHEVLPRLTQQWPQAVALLARTAQHAGDAAELLEEVAVADLDRCRWQDTATVLSVSALLALSPARQRNVLRYWLRVRGFLAPSTLHLDTLLSQLAGTPRTGHGRLAWPGTEIRRYRDQLHVMTPLTPLAPDLGVTWDLAQPLALPELGGRLQAAVVQGQGISRARLAGTVLQVRTRRGGEVCRLPGRTHHHKLKKLLQDRGVAPWWRDRLPLIYCGDQLVAVADLWVCAPYAAAAEEAGWQIHWLTP